MMKCNRCLSKSWCLYHSVRWFACHALQTIRNIYLKYSCDYINNAICEGIPGHIKQLNHGYIFKAIETFGEKNNVVSKTLFAGLHFDNFKLCTAVLTVGYLSFILTQWAWDFRDSWRFSGTHDFLATVFTAICGLKSGNISNNF